MRSMRNRRAGVLLAVAVLLTSAACGSSPAHHPAAVPTKTASAQPTTVAVPKSWVRASWPAAGFAGSFPARPHQVTVNQTFGGVRVTNRNDVVNRNGTPMEIGSATIGIPIPADGIRPMLRTMVYGFALVAANLNLQSAEPRDFRGRPAYRAIFTLNGRPFELLVFEKDAQHEIYVFGPEGLTFDALAASVKLLKTPKVSGSDGSGSLPA